jgi:peroxiredoxin
MELGYVMKSLSVRPLLALASTAMLVFLGACGQSNNSTPETTAPAAVALQDSPAAAPVTSTVVGMRVDDFQLVDQDGTAHELYDYRNAPAIVLMTQGNGCPIVRNAVPALRKVRDAYADKGVKFFLMNSNLQDNAESIAAEVAEFGFDMPVLVDQYQLVGESLNVTRTAEIFVIDTSDMTVAYHGPVDDRLNYQTQRATAQHEYLADALDAVIAGESVSVSSVDAPGCLINFPARS